MKYSMKLLNIIKIYTVKLQDRDLSNEDIFEKLSDKVIKLSSDQSSCLEGPLMYDEVTRVLKNTENNKFPGPDGFTVEI